jgi:hypothetical protein
MVVFKERSQATALSGEHYQDQESDKGKSNCKRLLVMREAQMLNLFQWNPNRTQPDPIQQQTPILKMN